ncbi:MAG: hypothetical protein AAGA68_21095 [Pseudomonadota bacterium]
MIEIEGCGQVITELSSPFLVDQRNALPNGKVDFVIDRTPERLCGFSLQVVDLTTCVATNVITAPEQP